MATGSFVTEKTQLKGDWLTGAKLEFPDYWPPNGWKKLWGGSGDEDAGDQQQVMSQFLQNKIEPTDFDSVILSRTSPMHKLICDYMQRNVALKSYKAPKREATRMEWARRIAGKEVKTPRDQKWKDSAEERLREGKKGGPAPPKSGAVEVRKIRILRNMKLWAGYQAMRQLIANEIEEGTGLRKVRFVIGVPETGKLPVLDAEIGEVLLFHGTGKDTMKKIARTGFDPTFCVNKGTAEKPNFGAVGRGTYFSDSFSKVMTYTVCEHCGAFKCDCSHIRESTGERVSSKRVSFLARVLLGAPKSAKAYGQIGKDAIRQDDLDSLPEGRHSVYARGAKLGDLKFVSGSNEFVVKDAYQMYPEFVIYWSHAESD